MDDKDERGDIRRDLPASLPVLVLTVLGAVVAVLGLFVAAEFVMVIVGLASVAIAGVLHVLGDRR